jgi:environmental stress-induced protein Ves
VKAIAASRVASQPWKNGGGRTRELFAWPDREQWRVRVSLADIEADGPFSPFPGVTRWFAVLEGGGVELAFDDRRVHVERGDAPFVFDGALAPMCRLVNGPTRDLNLMLRGVNGAMVLAADHRPWSPAGDECGLFAAVGGTFYPNNRPIRVEAETLLWFDDVPPVLRFAADHDTGKPIGWWLQFAAREGAQ